MSTPFDALAPAGRRIFIGFMLALIAGLAVALGAAVFA
jgi:hypothetical protein